MMKHRNYESVKDVLCWKSTIYIMDAQLFLKTTHDLPRNLSK
jgi:hypothetical protein